MEINEKSKKAQMKESSKIHKKLSKAITSITQNEKKDAVDIFTKPNNKLQSFIVYHFGNGDESDSDLLISYLSKNNISPSSLRIFPGISYAYVVIPENQLNSLYSSTEKIEMKDKELTVYYYLDTRKEDLKEDKIRPLFFFHTAYKLEDTNLFKLSTLPNSKEAQTDDYFIPGLVIIDDFISAEEEKAIVEEIEKNSWSKLSNRLVQHYGYEFIYGKNSIDKNKKIGPLPAFTDSIQNKFNSVLSCFQLNKDKSSKANCEFYDFSNTNSNNDINNSFLGLHGAFDQLTINKYSPGDGIPPHVDSHSPFYDIYCSISLLSGATMSFTHKSNESKHIYLKPRSAVFFTNEVRYDWEHSIGLRKVDLVDDKVKSRGKRISLTFRRIRQESECKCIYNQNCDTFKLNSGENNTFLIEKSLLEAEEPTEIEKKHVYAVYDKIAPHFSHTRYKPWPKVVDFLSSLDKYSLVGDIGCGNGKYLSAVKDLITIGTDRSINLSKIAYEKNPLSNLFVANSLYLPVRDNSLDAAISIAVIHHFSNDKLRIKAIKEIQRCVKKNGKFLIYVWALEQEDGKFKDQDNLVPWHLQNTFKENPHSSKEEISSSVEVKEKNSVVYHRYYHVFKKGELEKLIDTIEGIEILESYYDHENWCCICLNK